MTILAKDRHNTGWPRVAPETTWPAYNAPDEAHTGTKDRDPAWDLLAPTDYSNHKAARDRRELRGPLYINSVRVPFDLAWRFIHHGTDADIVEMLDCIETGIHGFDQTGLEL